MASPVNRHCASCIGTLSFPAATLMLRRDCVYTSRNSLRGSAVCAFKMADIVASFDGSHKEQKTPHSNWLPVRDADVPKPSPAKVSRPSACPIFALLKHVGRVLTLGAVSGGGGAWAA